MVDYHKQDSEIKEEISSFWANHPMTYGYEHGEQAYYDEEQHGHRWSTFARANATVDIVAGLHAMAEVSATVDQRFEQHWIGMLRIGYDLSGKAASRRVLR